jgi:hypothetical protein
MCVVLLAWLMLNAAIPQLHPDPRLVSIALLVPQAIIVVLLVLAFRHQPESSGDEALGDERRVLGDKTATEPAG